MASTSVLVMAAGICGALLAGFLAWIMIQRVSASKARAVLLTACGLLLLLLPVALAAGIGKREFVILLSAVSSMAYQGWSTLLYSAVADTLPARRVVIGAAIGALMGNLSGVLSSGAFGYAIQNSGYDLVFGGLALAAGLALLGVVLLAWLVRQEPARSYDTQQ